MNRTENWNRNPDEALDLLLGEIRADEPAREVMEAARARSWAHLQQAAAALPIENCSGFQALFPSYKDGTLTPARRMLVEDHLHECVACRRAFEASKVVAMPAAGAGTPARHTAHKAWMPSRWAIAAMLTIGVGIGSWSVWQGRGSAPSGSRARVLTADGTLYRVEGNQLTPVSTGSEIGEGVILRTAGGSHATVRLIDGSTLEVGDRAEFSVAATRRDTTVRLDRGQIIVQAAKRSSGHLYVLSGDSRVAVTGTIFSVNRGVAGARVSVVEGEVHVEHGGANDVLHAGDQVTTHPSIAKTTVADDIQWSRNYDQYLALLKQFVQIKGKLAEVQMPGLRYSSRLLDNVPEGTSIIVSLPNLSSAIRDFQRIVTEQAAQSPELQTWMKTQMPQFEKITSQLSDVGDYIGDEILFASQSCSGFCGVAIAEVNRPGLKEYLDAQLAKLGPDANLHLNVRFAGNKVIIGEQQQFIAAAEQGHSNFINSDFGRTVSDVYTHGAGMFVAADLESIFRNKHDRPEQASLLGFNNVRHLIAEQKTVGGKSQYSAVVAFRGERQGAASWLAAPGSMGSLDFVSPDAQFAAAFVVKQPAEMLGDMLRITQGTDIHQADFEKTFGVSLQQLASYLGGEITVAIDGPLVPVPAWKLVAEVKDAQGLQSALTKLVEVANQSLRQANQPELAIRQEVVNGRTYYSLRSPFAQIPMNIYYTWADGYLLAGPNRIQLDRALRDRAAGVTLSRSQDFRKLLPQNQRANMSGIVYQNASDVLQVLQQAASPEQKQAAAQISNSLDSTLVCLYGDNDRIELSTQGGPANLILQGIAGRLLSGNTATARIPEHRRAWARMGK